MARQVHVFILKDVLTRTEWTVNLEVYLWNLDTSSDDLSISLKQTTCNVQNI